MAHPTGPQWQPPPAYGWPPQPPVDAAASDGAYRWFKVYAGVLAALNALVAVGGVAFVALAGGASEQVSDQRLVAPVYIFGGLIGAVVFGVGLFLPRREWAWVYGIVLIALGMTSCCVMPVAIPLLIFWLKPEMKARFGRS